MSNLTILSENLIMDNSTDITMITGTENINFPLTNIKKNFTTKVFRSNENVCEILIDLKQNRPIDVISVVGSNLTGMGLTSLSYSISATSDFTGIPSTDVNVSQQYNFGYIDILPTVGRYIKLTVDNTGSFCEVSNLFIGKKLEFTYNGLSQDTFRFGIRDNSNSRSNEYGQDFVNKRNQMKFLNGNVKFANKEEVDLLDQVILRHINKTPLWIIIDKCSDVITDGNFRLSGYYRLNNRPDFSSAGPSLFNVSLTFQEVV